ncbi:hypothetical protein PV326_011076 [Microctonus aethiopoides]|nr:hypothetical protein PV326_011076 [Microctonus aethiopoides]
MIGSIRTHAAGAQINPQPSPSLSTNDCSPESITTRIDNQSTYVGINFKNFFNQFEINDKDLVKIDELDQPDIPDRSEIPSFTTTNNEKILATHNRQSTKHTHFKKKPPVRIFSKKLEYEPPGIQSEIIKTAIHHDGSKRTKSFPTNLSMDKNSKPENEDIFRTNTFAFFYVFDTYPRPAALFARTANVG